MGTLIILFGLCCFAALTALPLSAFAFSVGRGGSGPSSALLLGAFRHEVLLFLVDEQHEDDDCRFLSIVTVTGDEHRRRILLQSLLSCVITLPVMGPPLPANASPSLLGTPARDRRQLELCLVVVQRVVYWASLQADALRMADTTQEERKYKYLETRLGAKALLTGRLGSGATGRVYQLASLQLTGCLQDLEWHAAQQQQRQQQQQISEWRQTFTEGLSSLVEFDGLETLTDASPRSSLTLSQYNDSKAVYVRRALDELVIPAGNQLLQAFGSEALQTAQGYIQQYYSSEIYPLAPPPAPSTDTTAAGG